MTQIERLSSAVAGLDTVLCGGFPKGGIYIIQGPPGSGKTTLANQMCYAHAASGGRALYVTLLSESHARMLLHVSAMSFYDASCLPDSMAYISGFSALEDDGLPALVTLLRREVSARRSSVLVLDGVRAVGDRAENDMAFKRFIQELQLQAALYECTVFLLTSVVTEISPPEHTMVDGIVELADTRYDLRTERGLFVKKLRVSDYMPGRHSCRITSDGLVVYPRLESALRTPSVPDDVPGSPVQSGIPDLDRMLFGGFPATSSTALVGPSGVGKTTFGLQFLAASTEQEPGLLFSFHETPRRVREKARRLSLGLDPLVETNVVSLLWQAQTENIQDALAYKLLDAIAERNVRRLFIDGLDGFWEAAIDVNRLGRFFAVLMNEIRARGVTVLFTLETREVLRRGLEMPLPFGSALIDNWIALRFAETEARMRRLLAIIKVRDGDFDPTVRSFRIGPGGMVIGNPSDVPSHALRDAATSLPSSLQDDRG
ncbi:MAG: RAD55 family ATPase [Acetobacteraceae bacterium]